MDIDVFDLINLGLAIYQDIVEKEVIEEFKEATRIFLEAEGNCRRAKAQALLEHQFQMDIQLEKIKQLYERLKSYGGSSTVIEEYLAEMERKRTAISAERAGSIFK